MDVAERWTSTVVLGDGSSAVIRPMTPDDAPALAAFHLRQSAESRYFRFFSPKPELNEGELERFTTVDFVDRVAFVVEEHDEFIGWASYERWNNRDDAEVAFMVDDQHQGKGIATLMLEHLAAVARANGIERFTAQTLGDNRRMLSVFAKAGWPVHRRFESGVIDVDFPLADTSSFIDSVERREQRADSRAMARVLLATSVAVIGASDTPDSVGEALWRIMSSDPKRRTYPVNPHRATVGGVTAYPTVGDVPDDIGLALVAVPASSLETTLQQCIDKRVRGAVVVTSASGSAGAAIDIAAIVAHARRSGLRIIGPGSMGIASPRDDIALNASLAEVRLPPGNVGISMQSGTLGIGLLRLAAQLQLPISWFVSLGDKADVSGNDLLQFWEDDEATEVIAIYTESLGNPRKFARIARRVARRRPVVAVRTGAALIGAGNEALYRDTGVIEVPTVTAMLDTARVLATQPLPEGRRVAVISNSSSPAVLASATLRAVALDVVEPPVQLTFHSSADDYHHAVTAALAADDIDAVLVIHAPPLASLIGTAADQMDRACAGTAKPVVAVMLGAGDGPILPGSAVPSFSFPEQAAAVLGRIAAYAEWRRTEGADEADPDELPDHIDVAGAGLVLAELLAGPDGTALAPGLTVEAGPEQVGDLLDRYGVTMSRARRVATDDPTAVVAAADELGYPVAVKSLVRRAGRTAEAGVALDLVDAADVERAVATMRSHLGSDAATVMVQRMAPPGVDIRIRARDDDRVGPVITVGLGGIQADAIADESSRLAPVSPATAMSMIADSRAAAALGAEAHERLADVVSRVAQLASDHPEIAELDLNPVVVNADGCCVVDATLVARRPERPEPAVRRLE
jgi:acyl-CoA synthetase (NDP forming)/RimJ/RimL family protein N-acetyltransferase